MRKAESVSVPGEQLTFHGWTTRNAIVYAVVEYPDGRVEEVDPPSIKFVDQVKAHE